MNRYDAREYALSLLFASDFHPQTPYDQLYEDMTQDEILQADAYIADVASHYAEYASRIDELIGKYMKPGWTLERISGVSRAVIRLALYEILAVDSLPAAVSVNEAVELAKKYDGEEAPAFVNGILGSILRSEELAKEQE
ncbi:MAG: transcription antitermination factor NusB [Clostridia bacterium]|nr:transcription antitermination factor NusB [Clostridia bacterium]